MWDSLKEQIEEIGSAKLTGSDAAAYITGQVLCVDGGMQM